MEGASAMINPKPGTDAWRVLDQVVRFPGELDAEAIGQRLWKPKITSSADYLRVRACMVGQQPEWSARASKLLGQLSTAGLVERMRPPALADGVPSFTGRGWPDFRDWVAPLVEDLDRQIQTSAVACLGALVQGTPPQSVREWLGPKPSGPQCRGAAALYEAGIVVPPTFRWPTPKGTELIDATRSAA